MIFDVIIDTEMFFDMGSKWLLDPTLTYVAWSKGTIEPSQGLTNMSDLYCRNISYTNARCLATIRCNGRDRRDGIELQILRRILDIERNVWSLLRNWLWYILFLCATAVGHCRLVSWGRRCKLTRCADFLGNLSLTFSFAGRWWRNMFRHIFSHNEPSSSFSLPVLAKLAYR